MYRLSIFVLCTLVGCSTLELHADAIYTKSKDVQKLDIAEHYLQQPPPQVYVIKHDTIFTPPPAANYGPLLSLLHTAPGGTAISLAHLKSLTPYAMALVPIYKQLGQNQLLNMTWQQLFAIPQVAALYNAAQALLYPLGLWNQTSLNWIIQNWRQFVNPLVSLYNQLIAAGVSFTPLPTIKTVHPIEVLTIINELWEKSDWLELAEVGPKLIYSLVRHLGYAEPLVVLYGSKARNYAPALWTQEGSTNYTLNQEEGFQSHSLSEEFYQGEDDISLNYYPVTVTNKVVRTLDVISSERAILLKRMAGGNTNLLDRAETRNTGMLSIGLKGKGFRTRIVVGRTSYMELAGGIASWDLESKYLRNHIALGVFVEGDRFVGYAEDELTALTPRLTIKGDEKAELWAEATLALSMLSSNLKFQGDARIIPELHATVTIHDALLHVYAGTTLAAAPRGLINLERPYKAIGPVFIRLHVGTELRVRISEHWRAEVNVVAEFSKLYKKTKARATVGYRWVSLSALSEFRNDRERYGAGIEIGPVRVQGLWPDLLQAGITLEF